MAREERSARAPQPDREHPVAVAISNLQRKVWGTLYEAIATNDAESKEAIKAMMVKRLDAIKAQVAAL